MSTDTFDWSSAIKILLRGVAAVVKTAVIVAVGMAMAMAFLYAMSWVFGFD